LGDGWYAVVAVPYASQQGVSKRSALNLIAPKIDYFCALISQTLHLLEIGFLKKSDPVSSSKKRCGAARRTAERPCSKRRRIYTGSGTYADVTVGIARWAEI
jgi:hypothetical protein